MSDPSTNPVARVADWLKTRVGIVVLMAAGLTAGATITGYLQTGWRQLVGVGVVPHLAKLEGEIATAAGKTSEIIDRLDEITVKLAAIEARQDASADPIIRFARTGHRISDTTIGEFALVSWVFFRLRNDCGAPFVSLFFRDAEEVVHRFTNLSIANEAGQGRAVEALPNVRQDIKYTARVPATQGVTPGPAVAWVELFYPACPSVPSTASPEVPFTILPPA